MELISYGKFGKVLKVLKVCWYDSLIDIPPQN